MKFVIFIIALSCIFARGTLIKRLNLVNNYSRSPILDIGIIIAILSPIISAILAEYNVISYSGSMAFTVVVIGTLTGLAIALAGTAIEFRKNTGTQ